MRVFIRVYAWNELHIAIISFALSFIFFLRLFSSLSIKFWSSRKAAPPATLVSEPGFPLGGFNNVCIWDRWRRRGGLCVIKITEPVLKPQRDFTYFIF